MSTTPDNYPSNILLDAARTIAERGRTRDTSPDGQQVERSMADTVAAFNLLEGTALTESQGWRFMALLKHKRAVSSAANGHYHADDYLDGAAYTALAAEAALGEAALGEAAWSEEDGATAKTHNT